jgi:hypothetical protein
MPVEEAVITDEELFLEIPTVTMSPEGVEEVVIRNSSSNYYTDNQSRATQCCSCDKTTT